MNETLLDPSADLQPRPSRAVTWRSLSLGLAGVALICGLTPYNDYVVKNTYLVGNFLPVGLLLLFVAFIVLVNAPLLRWRRGSALSSGELTVALGMALVSCALPSSGLMRYLPGALVGLQYHAQVEGNNAFRTLMQDLDLPRWMFPHSPGAPLPGVDPVVQQYVDRTPVTHGTLSERFAGVPWGAWVVPAIAWGLLLSLLYGAFLCLCVLLRRQWVENERLAFPLATIYLALVETPPSGRSLNRLLSSRIFWAAAGGVFILHGMNALHEIVPRVPTISIGYSLGSMFADDPWKAADESFKRATVYFSVVAIVFFLRTTLSFGLFFFYLLLQVGARVLANLYGTEISPGQTTDLAFGASLPLAAGMLWLARSHLAMVGRQMFRGVGPGEPKGRYLSYAVCGWGLIVCVIGVVVWLVIAGMSVAGAVTLILMMLMLMMLMTRIVAETGLLFVQLPIPMNRPWIYAVGTLEGMGARTTIKSFFYTTWFTSLFTNDMREAMPVYASHALRVADDTTDANNPRTGRLLIAALGLALVVGFLIAGVSTLWCEYGHAITLDQTEESPINSLGVLTQPRAVLSSTLDYLPPKTGPREAHSRIGMFSIGFGAMALLAVLRIRFVGWPLHPFGLLLAYSYPMKRIWFSIMIGWLAKVIITRIGGTELYRACIPLFIGLLIGESAAAGFWLIVSLVMVALGHPYVPVQLTPT